MCEEMNFTTRIKNSWDGYFQTVGTCQLNNNGIIFLDEYNLPIDNEFEIEELFNKFVNEDIETNTYAYDMRFYLSAKRLNFVSDYSGFAKIRDQLTYWDRAFKLEDVGKKIFEIFFDTKMEELNNFKNHINFAGIGKDFYLNRKDWCGFTKYGFIIKNHD